MGKLTAYLMRSFRVWDRPSQIAFLIGIALLLLTLIALIVGGTQLRQPALIGLVGLIIALQIVFMWGNRDMVTPFTQAQRAYLAENFDHARQILETLQVAGKADFRSLTLLGNTYRQLGRLDESEEVLTKALALRPQDHFPLYGIGRTLLVKGFFAQAADKMSQAIDAGAPPIVRVDLAEAFYRAGFTEEARAVLLADTDIPEEAHRALMSAYLRYRLDIGRQPSSDLVWASLPYWEVTAARFQATPYGQLLAEDIQQLRTFTEES